MTRRAEVQLRGARAGHHHRPARARPAAARRRRPSPRHAGSGHGRCRWRGPLWPPPWPTGSSRRPASHRSRRWWRRSGRSPSTMATKPPSGRSCRASSACSWDGSKAMPMARITRPLAPHRRQGPDQPAADGRPGEKVGHRRLAALEHRGERPDQGRVEAGVAQRRRQAGRIGQGDGLEVVIRAGPMTTNQPPNSRRSAGHCRRSGRGRRRCRASARRTAPGHGDIAGQLRIRRRGDAPGGAAQPRLIRHTVGPGRFQHGEDGQHDERQEGAERHDQQRAIAFADPGRGLHPNAPAAIRDRMPHWRSRRYVTVYIIILQRSRVEVSATGARIRPAS